MEPNHLERMRICLGCETPCELFQNAGVAAAMQASCPLSRWIREEPKELPGSYTDHEKEAAQAGMAVECCGSGNEKRGAVTPTVKNKVVKTKWYLTSCAIVRDELDLPEWVAYQFVIGFEHVHIYDNESVLQVDKVLENWIKDGKVTVSKIKGRSRQIHAYTDYLRKTESRWTAFIDPDEFILMHKSDDLKLYLEQFEPYGGLGVFWSVFGSSGRVTRPAGLVIESYDRCGPVTFHIHAEKNPPGMAQYKTIAQVPFTNQCANPHYFRHTHGLCSVSEKKLCLEMRSDAIPSINDIQINHYMCKSAQDWIHKQGRRGGASNRPRTERDWNVINAACNESTDTRIFRYIPAVRELMGKYQ